jgi:hypothetical protein
MLPGFRFLFAAIVLSMSILVFGLGATALLRAAHEQFASNPSWHAAPGANFAQAAEASRPVLAMLRVEPEQKSDSGPAVGIAAPAEPAAMAPPPLSVAQPEQMAALKPQEVATPVPAAATPEPAMESTLPAEVAPAPAVADMTGTAAPEAETKVASTEPASPLPPANDAMATAPAAAASEQISAPAMAQTDVAATKIATLGGPPVAIEAEPPPAKAAADAKPNRDALRKRQQARRAAQRRRLAAHARLAARQTQLQQPADPFTQPSAQPPAAARSR